MNFIFKPSLQHIAIVKIVTTLLSQDDTDAIVEKAFCRRQKKIENELIEKVRTMSLPELIEKRVIGAIKPIYDEVITWRDYHAAFGYPGGFTDFVKHPKPYWTSQGTVDKRKTAKMWIRMEEIDLDSRFRLACMYCFHNDVATLWGQMTEDLKQMYSDEIDELAVVFKLVTPGHTSLNELMPSERSESEKYEHEFLYAALRRNTVAAEYFWKKLEPERKEECLERTTERLVKDHYWGMECITFNVYYYGETLCFLLSQMTDKQQKEVFKICPHGVLKSLLEWPRQNLFLEIAEQTLHFLKEYDYRLLVFHNILGKINMHYTDCNYLEIFKECWKQSTAAHKKFVFNDHAGLCLLFSLFQTNDKKCIEWVLKDATDKDKSNLICTRSSTFIKLLMDVEECDLPQLFLQEIISPKDEMTAPKKCLW